MVKEGDPLLSISPGPPHASSFGPAAAAIYWYFTFNYYVKQISSIVSKYDTDKRDAIPVIIRITLTLRFLPCGTVTEVYTIFLILSPLISLIIIYVCSTLVTRGQRMYALGGLRQDSCVREKQTPIGWPPTLATSGQNSPTVIHKYVGPAHWPNVYQPL